jgi:hypothetical protein
MAKRKPGYEIAGQGPGEREHAPSHPSGSWTDGDARGDAHVCPDCGEPISRDETRPRPFDMTCESCLAIREELARRIEESLESLRDAEAGLTDYYMRPVRPAWVKWRRLKKRCAHCGEQKPEREFPYRREPYVPAEFADWCKPCMVAEERRRREQGVPA